MNIVKQSQSNSWQRFHQVWQSRGINGILATIWSYFWMSFAGLGFAGRIATWLATWLAPPFKMRKSLARYHAKGYISPSATVAHNALKLGKNIFIGDRVTIFQHPAGGTINLGTRAHLHNDNVLETGEGGTLTIGSNTHVQVGCQFSALQGSIQIGDRVQIAPECIFDAHPVHRPVQQEKILNSSNIVVDDDAWIGHGVTILPGVNIGKGAVIGSGSMVEQDIPPQAIAVGVPAQVVKMRV
ncbi:hypothetical protein [Pleurocapsa sp. PCC 7319]|uniref:acyltransferase n=1 Tax=Pleurocapsa sp. PCC 7319 TaxID=118161 RepID=UPI0003482608|nr:hypothetical protein [Pleurocapsa sp. PCC 7319]